MIPQFTSSSSSHQPKFFECILLGLHTKGWPRQLHPVILVSLPQQRNISFGLRIFATENLRKTTQTPHLFVREGFSRSLKDAALDYVANVFFTNTADIHFCRHNVFKSWTNNRMVTCGCGGPKAKYPL